MNIDDIDYVVIFTTALIISVSLAGYWYDSQCEYENITTMVTGKWEKEYTTLVVGSTGKSSYVIPVHHHDYYLNTTYGRFPVTSVEYDLYNIGDEINLTRNINTTDIRLKGD